MQSRCRKTIKNESPVSSSNFRNSVPVRLLSADGGFRFVAKSSEAHFRHLPLERCLELLNIAR